MNREQAEATAAEFSLPVSEPASKWKVGDVVTLASGAAPRRAGEQMVRQNGRDATMILIAFRHGMRASELCTLRWDNIDLGAGKVHVNRAKNGSPSVHPLAGVELRALRRLRREAPESPFVFVSERDAPFARTASARW
jgi:integrase